MAVSAFDLLRVVLLGLESERPDLVGVESIPARLDAIRATCRLHLVGTRAGEDMHHEDKETSRGGLALNVIEC